MNKRKIMRPSIGPLGTLDCTWVGLSHKLWLADGIQDMNEAIELHFHLSCKHRAF